MILWGESILHPADANSVNPSGVILYSAIESAARVASDVSRTV
jgi:hypothetical protein